MENDLFEGFDELDRINTNNQSNNEEEVSNKLDTEEEYILYILIDKELPGLLEYAKERGVSVSKVFNNIVDIKNTMIMQTEPTHLVVIETGIGRFTATKMREELIDLLGICDEQNIITVFYCDEVIKSDTAAVIGKISKGIKWEKLDTIVSALATIASIGLKYRCRYGKDNNTIIESAELLKYKGVEGEEFREEQHESRISSNMIGASIDSQDYEEIQRYDIEV